MPVDPGDQRFMTLNLVPWPPNPRSFYSRKLNRQLEFVSRKGEQYPKPMT
jgi:hypothetical protein